METCDSFKKNELALHISYTRIPIKNWPIPGYVSLRTIKLSSEILFRLIDSSREYPFSRIHVNGTPGSSNSRHVSAEKFVRILFNQKGPFYTSHEGSSDIDDVTCDLRTRANLHSGNTDRDSKLSYINLSVSSWQACKRVKKFDPLVKFDPRPLRDKKLFSSLKDEGQPRSFNSQDDSDNCPV